MKRATLADGTIALFDETTSAYLESSEPEPTQRSMIALLDRVRAVRVMRDGSAGGKAFGSEILAHTNDPRDVEALKSSLQIFDGQMGHCMCHGDPSLVMLDAAGTQVAVLGVHHGKGIRWDAWRGDAALTNGRALLTWLAARGVRYPLEEYERAEQPRLLAIARTERRRAAMPSCLLPFSESLLEPGKLAYKPDLLIPALDSYFPHGAEKALALFEWFGQGEGPWSRYPSYEGIPLLLLLTMPLSQLLDAIRFETLSEAQLEGAARFFASREFRSQREGDSARLMSSDRRRLLEHALSVGDEDRRERATRAFRED